MNNTSIIMYRDYTRGDAKRCLQINATAGYAAVYVRTEDKAYCMRFKRLAAALEYAIKTGMSWHEDGFIFRRSVSGYDYAKAHEIVLLERAKYGKYKQADTSGE